MNSVFLFFLLALPPQRQDTGQRIESLMSNLYEDGEFNGCILVAVNGNVLYKKGFGMANFEMRAPFTPSTSSCIASVTKQFTAMGIMMLEESKKLGYDDPVTKFLPRLPQCYDAVTIRHLLTHTSGVYDYDDIGRGRPDKLIQDKKSLRFSPGTRYDYSNSNYVLLSEIIKKAAGMSCIDFLQQKIFTPLHMTHTFAYGEAIGKMPDVARGYSQFGKNDDYTGTTFFGDGGIFSTVEDLFKWDQALYTEQLVKQSTLSQAFSPGAVREGGTTYGFGWNITMSEDGTTVWHTGNTAGFRAYIQRNLDAHATVIILTNKGNSRRIEIGKAVMDILKGRPYVAIRPSAAKKMYTIIMDKGLEAARSFYDSTRALKSQGGFDFIESDFNLMGYQLLNDKMTQAAIEVFKMNTEMFPDSGNTFDSLGEAYLINGDKTLAKENYQKALELDPSNEHAADVVKRLR